MKCLILSQEFPPGPGGLGTHAFEVARNLVRLGWKVRVATNQDHVPDPDADSFNSRQPFSVRRIPRRAGPLATAIDRWKIGAEELDRFRPDIMMGTGDRANYTAADLASKFDLPWVAIEHGCVPQGLERTIKLKAYAAADALVCVSNYTWRQTERMGVKPRRLEIIPNGADSGRFRRLPREDVARIRQSLDLAGQQILLTVGSVHPRKGQDTVIRALPRILESAPETHYLCAGFKQHADAFGALAKELRVGERVRFLGPVDDRRLVELMNAADVFVMTSRHTGDEFEGYGIAVVEAALCETPSVVTLDSGLGEAIVDGQTGIGVATEDPNATAEAIIKLLADEDLRKRMGEAARARGEAEQTWEQRVALYDRLFREVAVARRGRRVL